MERYDDTILAIWHSLEPHGRSVPLLPTGTKGGRAVLANMSAALKAAPYATGALASILSTGAFFTYHAKRNTYVDSTLYGVPNDGVERENYHVKGKQSAFRPVLSTLSFLYGYCVDTVYALCAGYGRGKLHFETGYFGPLRETAVVARNCSRSARTVLMLQAQRV